MGQLRREEIRRKREELKNHSLIDDVTGLYIMRDIFISGWTKKWRGLNVTATICL
jgi:hypothetical protein